MAFTRRVTQCFAHQLPICNPKSPIRNPDPVLLSSLNPADTGILWVMLALVAGLVCGALLVLVAVMHRRWVRPVRSLAKSAEKMSLGAWGERATAADDASEDVRQLGDRLNSIAGKAQSQMAALEQQSGNLQLLVDALPDPILVADERERVVLANAAAARLLDVPALRLVGKSFVSAVSEASILELFESVLRLSPSEGRLDSTHREIRLIRDGQRLTFQALGERTAAGGVLIVLRDVSTLASTLQMKTDFVANASHELRTPISAIKVAFETLRDVYRDDDVEVTERCIGIIDGHLRRLEEMLRDLLDLSRIESATLKPHLAPVRAVDLAAAVRSSWSEVAREKGVDLVLLPDPASQELVFTSDRRLLDLIAKNLVENAIKFTPAGGRVTLAVEPDGESSVAIRVTDTGIGIPPEHLERVFERFYQVDQARTGFGARGTGLGLAIVKHAANALNGTVKLASAVGQGTTVTCSLPT
jgi:two-component system phosphate regulon sensor histidine kinase PhoR